MSHAAAAGWQDIDESEMLRAWALAEVTSSTSPMQQAPDFDPVREKLRAGGADTLTPADWQLLERGIRWAREPILGPLLALRPRWYRAHLPVEVLADARTIGFPLFVAKAPSRRLAALCAAEGHPGAAPGEFRREAMTAPPILVGVTLEGPWCLAEGYRRCCRAIRDQQAECFDGLPLPVIVGVGPEMARWTWWR